MRSMDALSNSDVFGKMSKVTLFSSKTSVYKPEMNTPCIELRHRQRSDFLFLLCHFQFIIPIFFIRCQVKFGKNTFIHSLEKIFYTKKFEGGSFIFLLLNGAWDTILSKIRKFSPSWERRRRHTHRVLITQSTESSRYMGERKEEAN